MEPNTTATRIEEAVRQAYAANGRDYLKAFTHPNVVAFEKTHGSTKAWSEAIAALADIRSAKTLIPAMKLESILVKASLRGVERSTTSCGLGALSLVVKSAEMIVSMQQVILASMSFDKGTLTSAVTTALLGAEIRPAGSGQVLVRIPYEVVGG